MSFNWTIDPCRVRGGTVLRDLLGNVISTDSSLNTVTSITVAGKIYTRSTVASATGQATSAGKTCSWSTFSGTMAAAEAEATWKQIVTSMLESLDVIELVEPPSYLIEINAITVDDAVKYSKIKSGLKALAAKDSEITLDEVLELMCYYQWTSEYSKYSVGSTAWQEELDRFRECIRDPESNLMVSKTLQVYMGESVKRAPATYENLLRAVIAREELKKAEAARKQKAIKELQKRINEMQQQLDALQNGGGSSGGGEAQPPAPPPPPEGEGVQPSPPRGRGRVVVINPIPTE